MPTRRAIPPRAACSGKPRAPSRSGRRASRGSGLPSPARPLVAWSPDRSPWLRRTVWTSPATTPIFGPASATCSGASRSTGPPASSTKATGGSRSASGTARDDALGRPVNVHARLGQLRYWIDGSARIRQVERIARGLRVLTTFEAFARATPGRILPAQTTTCTWDLASGALLQLRVRSTTAIAASSMSGCPSARRITAGRSGPDAGRDLAPRARAALTPGPPPVLVRFPYAGATLARPHPRALRGQPPSRGERRPCKAIRGSSTC